MFDSLGCEVLNGNLMSNLWVLQTILILYLIGRKVMCSGVFEISLLKINNNRGVTHNGRCCTGPSTYPPCVGECDTFLTVCLMHHVQSMPLPRTCTYGSSITTLLGGNNIPPRSENDVIKIPIDFVWPEKFTLIVEAWHAVNANLTYKDSTQLIIQSFISSSVLPKLEWSTDTTITPTSEQKIKYRLVCNRHYYGNGCDILCRPRDDRFGHFSCSSNGTKVCKSGWSGEFCDQPQCSEECIKNGGQCERPNECRCRLGWQGKNCEECRPYNGCLRGYCHQPYQCICEDGWKGLQCDIDTQYCQKSEPCMHGGTCIPDLMGNYTCLCPPGFGGRNCINALCYHGYCKHNGSCVTRGGQRECLCLNNFYGERCEYKILSCNEISCLHGGECVTGDLGGYCKCTEAYKGNRCQHRVKPCSSNPCENGGECRESDKTSLGYVCLCPPGYGGLYCSIEIDPCAATNCLHGGICQFKTGYTKPECKCAEGYTGEFCEIKSDECVGVKCKNNGVCKPSPMGNGFLCHCTKGYHGEVCELEMNPCESSPCRNGGSCKNYISKFRCICSDEYSGKYCEHKKLRDEEISSTQNDGAADPLDFEVDKTDTSKTIVNGSNSVDRTISRITFTIVAVYFSLALSL